MLSDSERPYEDDAILLALNAWFDGEAEPQECERLLGLLEAKPDLADALRVMRDTRVTMLEIGDIEPPLGLTENIMAAVRASAPDQVAPQAARKRVALAGAPVACAAVLLLAMVLRTAAPRNAIEGMLARSSLISDANHAPAAAAAVAPGRVRPVSGPVLFQPEADRVDAASQLAANALETASRIALNLVTTPSPRTAAARPDAARTQVRQHIPGVTWPPDINMIPPPPAVSLASSESDASADFMAKSDANSFTEVAQEPVPAKGIEHPVRAVTVAATPPQAARPAPAPPVVHRGRLMLSELPPASHFNGMDVKQQIAAMNMGYSRETLENIKRHVAAISIIDSSF
ncbi:MAG: hypothetical protein KGJ62_14280 [Armatimonadetes bacterium]|nr:hypothetical protein [Armatimonadota bacterium]MDE2207075.1 hypothetical protein [Armatimonadota bacterium]